MSKGSYREFFAQCKPAIKLSYFCQIAHVPATTLSMFIKSDAYDYMMSLDACKRLYDAITGYFANIA